MFKNYLDFLSENSSENQTTAAKLINGLLFTGNHDGNNRKMIFRFIIENDRIICIVPQSNLDEDFSLYTEKKFEPVALETYITPDNNPFYIWFMLNKDSKFSSAAASERFIIEKIVAIFDENKPERIKDLYEKRKEILFNDPIFLKWWEKRSGLRNGMKFGL
jgi:hypothetical protein